MNPTEDYKEFECTECGTPVERDGQVCSGVCHEASML